MFENLNTPSDFLSIWLNNKFLDEEGQKVFNVYYGGYIKHFPERMKFFYDNQLEDALKIIEKHDNLKVLEVGCGLGTESLFMALKGADVLGVDIKDDRLATAVKRKKVIEKDLGIRLNCKFEKKSILDFDENEKFDIIWIEQAFHHLEPREEVVKRISSLLNVGGHLIISESNAWNPLIQFTLFKVRGFETVCYYKDDAGEKFAYGNERILTSSKLSSLFSDLGIEKQLVRYFRIFPNHKFFNNFFAFEKMMSKILVPFFTHYNFIAKKTK